ncbi:hypothetical protein BaRGS_00032979 [Batillaria attramentaria]|uniref:Uncharacterized protein n=1 Tax=Batillaria attramentaria TaxID=370345 RepID=A0ABD0JLT1_9CAEN
MSLHNLTKHAFQPFKHCENFCSTNNPGLSYALIEQAVFIVSSLNDLSLRNTTLGKFPAKAFIHHPLPQLRKAEFGMQPSLRRELVSVCTATSLIVLNLDKSKIAQVVTDFHHLACKPIVLARSGLFVFRKPAEHGRSMFPRLERFVSSLPTD